MNQAPHPFQTIIVAYDESAAAGEALNAGIELCKLLGTPLQTITVIEPPPMYTGLVVAVDPDVAKGIETDRRRFYEELIESAVAEGRRHSVEITGHLVEAEEIDGLISFLRVARADLLIIGLRQHNSHIARLWSTVSSLEENAPCSVLAVHPRMKLMPTQSTAIKTVWMSGFANYVRPANPAAKGVVVNDACPACSIRIIDPSPNQATTLDPQGREPKAIVDADSVKPATSDCDCGDCESRKARAKDEEIDESDEGQQSYERVEEALGRAEGHGRY
jgi:nucleotide-binding universal stress UspA family protein